MLLLPLSILQGNRPDCRDELIINVITGKGSSIYSTTNGVGTGSNEHDFIEDRIIMCLTSSIDRDLKLINEFYARLLSMSCVDALEFTAFPRLEWTPVTLPLKNLPMLFATISGLDQRGKVKFLHSDNNEPPALVEAVFLNELIVECTTRLVHQQCCIIPFLFEGMSWFNKRWSTTGRILSWVICIEAEHPSQLDQRRSAGVSLEEARHVRWKSWCEGGIQLVKHHFFKQFGNCRKDIDWSVIVLVGTSSSLGIGMTLLIWQSLGKVPLRIQ